MQNARSLVHGSHAMLAYRLVCSFSPLLFAVCQSCATMAERPGARSTACHQTAPRASSDRDANAVAPPGAAEAAIVLTAAGEEGRDAEPEMPSSSEESSDPSNAAEASSPSGDDQTLNLKVASPEATDQPILINLASALRLSDARPLIVAAAQASAWVAEAQLQRAQVLWVPQLDIGAIYFRHDGFGPDFNRGVNHPSFGFPGGGGPLNQNLNYFYGYGSIYQSVNLTDAIFVPLAARQVLDSRRLEIQAAKNDSLRATANAYFDVHQYRGQYAAALDVVERGGLLVERIAHLSEDLVPRIEVDRSKRI